MSSDKVVMYGIPNCGSIKKARSWLAEHDIDYEFHDYKKKGLGQQQLLGWVKTLGWEALLNRKGMTWRKLDQAVRDSIDEQSAIEIMLENQSIIKRPLLQVSGDYLVGFDEAAYQKEFSKA